MTDPAISQFFQDRKEAWLKKNIKASMTSEEVKEKEQECEDIFTIKNWVPRAADRAKSRALSTHPSKFSHPSTGVGHKNIKEGTYVTPIIYLGERRCDGFLRTGNVELSDEVDSLGDASCLDVEQFLKLVLVDGERLMDHLKTGSVYIQEKLSEVDDYKTVVEGFLKISEEHKQYCTNSKIKQVYFPVDDDYHLLSVLTPSPLVFELRKRIDKIRFSEETKAAREARKANDYHEDGYKDIFNITTIGYGGTKPQNISVLNNQNGGKAHLLLSMPPQIKKYEVAFPSADFFAQSLNHFMFIEQLLSLHSIFSRYKNNIEVRTERDAFYQDIVDRIVGKMWAVRGVCDQQYMESSSQLPKYQKIWLCSEFLEIREESDDWLDKIVKDITSFIFVAYEKALGKKAIMFGDGEFNHVLKLVNENREALR